jgi:hypothetical protein
MSGMTCAAEVLVAARRGIGAERAGPAEGLGVEIVTLTACDARGDRAARVQRAASSTTAVPQTVTISIPFLSPRT